MKGKIKWFNTEKGYGFITGEDGQDYFLHKSVLPQGTTDLKEGTPVTFDTFKTERGLQAKDVTLEEDLK